MSFELLVLRYIRNRRSCWLWHSWAPFGNCLVGGVVDGALVKGKMRKCYWCLTKELDWPKLRIVAAP